jgi:DNA polymerase III alpha subunit (gram-positive type)
MSQPNDQRIYLDLEYCYPEMTRESGRPSSKDLRQVIQIAAIKYDHGCGKELASFNVLTKPPFTKQLPPFFTELTEISQAQVNATAIEYLAGLAEFTNFCEQTTIYTFDQDWGVLQQNCAYYQADFPFANKPFERIKTHLAGWGLPPDASYSSGTLYKAAGLAMDGHVHNALHDVRSMAAATYFFERSC